MVIMNATDDFMDGDDGIKNFDSMDASVNGIIMISQEFRLNAPQVSEVDDDHDSSSISTSRSDVENPPISCTDSHTRVGSDDAQETITRLTVPSTAATETVSTEQAAYHASVAQSDTVLDNTSNYTCKQAEPKVSKRYLWIGSIVLGILFGTGVILILVIVLKEKNKNPSSGGHDPIHPPGATLAPTAIIPQDITSPTMQSILDRGRLICGIQADTPGFAVLNTSTNTYEGFEADLVSRSRFPCMSAVSKFTTLFLISSSQCRAVAAAIFGLNYQIQYISLTGYERFPALHEKRVDILARTTTFTMQRALHEVSTSRQYRFVDIDRSIYSFGRTTFPSPQRVLHLALVSPICTMDCFLPACHLTWNVLRILTIQGFAMEP